MRYALRLTIGAALAAATLFAAASLPAQEWTVTTETHRFMEVRNGIWLTQTTARVFNSNALVIVNDEDVVLVDSHVTPAKARDLIASIPAITDKPVTAVINSHFHWDHAHGNQEFADVPIIGHEYTRMKMATAPLDEPTYVQGTTGNAATLERLAEQIEAAESDEEREELETFRAMFAAHAADFDEIDPLPPDVTMNEKMTLFRAGREIRIMFVGRAHTGGRHRRLLPAGQARLHRRHAVRRTVVHGRRLRRRVGRDAGEPEGARLRHRRPGARPAALTDLSAIEKSQEYYRVLWERTAEKHAAGVPAEEASGTLDLSATAFPDRQPSDVEVRRMYDRMENPD